MDEFREKKESSTKRKRARTPHSKGGCITCKIRHIKCDERKPLCLRCEKSGWSCDGYQTAEPAPARPQRHAPKTLIPKPPSRGPSPSLTPALRESNHFQTPEEYRCFQSFRDQTVYQLSGFFDFNLWGGLVLQACEAESSIRHAAIALGALNFQAGSDHSPNEKLLRQEFAYGQYSQAIKEVWSATYGGTYSLRTNLIASLLFACFELFNENTESAYAQIHSGIKLIKDWGLEPSFSHTGESLTTPANLWLVEDDILHAFGRLELRVTTYCDSDTALGRLAEARLPRNRARMDIGNMASFFTTFPEARSQLELITRHSLAFSVLPSTCTVPKNLIDPALFNSELRPEHYEVISALERWQTAFTPLWERSQRPDFSSTYLGAASLRLEFLTVFLRTWAYTQTEDICGERFLPELAEILELSKMLMANTPAYENDIVFSLEGMAAAPLCTVGMRFRHRKMRREATQLLLKNKRQEGVWQTVIVGRAMEWFGELEESGLGDEVEYVPADRLIKELEWRSENRTTRLRCLQPSRDNPGEWIRREKLLKWDGQDERPQKPWMGLQLQIPEFGQWVQPNGGVQFA